MTPLRQLFQKQQAGFTVYSPDCARSGLWGNLDQAIHAVTGFQPLYRHWIRHDVNSTRRFYSGPNGEAPPYEDPQEAALRYDNMPVEALQYGHLVMKLFLSGPSLLTIWQGEQVVESLLALKGHTHPAEAAPESIRGRFWCDNAVANLLHSSDDYAEAERELRAVNLTHVLDAAFRPLPLLEPIALATHFVPHSGTSVLCEIVNRLFMTLPDSEKLAVRLPPSGDAKETNQALTKLLQETARRTAGSTAATFIDAFLAGDLLAVTHMLNAMPVTRWEHFIIQCAAITRDKWNAQA